MLQLRTDYYNGSTGKVANTKRKLTNKEADLRSSFQVSETTELSRLRPTAEHGQIIYHSSLPGYFSDTNYKFNEASLSTSLFTFLTVICRPIPITHTQDTHFNCNYEKIKRNEYLALKELSEAASHTYADSISIRRKVNQP